MKKIVAFILVLVIIASAFALAACGDTGNPSGGNVGGQTQGGNTGDDTSGGNTGGGTSGGNTGGGTSGNTGGEGSGTGGGSAAASWFDAVPKNVKIVFISPTGGNESVMIYTVLEKIGDVYYKREYENQDRYNDPTSVPYEYYMTVADEYYRDRDSADEATRSWQKATYMLHRSNAVELYDSAFGDVVSGIVQYTEKAAQSGTETVCGKSCAVKEGSGYKVWYNGGIPFKIVSTYGGELLDFEIILWDTSLSAFSLADYPNGVSAPVAGDNTSGNTGAASEGGNTGGGSASGGNTGSGEGGGEGGTVCGFYHDTDGDNLCDVCHNDKAAHQSSTHVHIDENGDGVCDEDNWYMLSLDLPSKLSVRYYDNFEYPHYIVLDGNKLYYKWCTVSAETMSETTEDERLYVLDVNSNMWDEYSKDNGSWTLSNDDGFQNVFAVIDFITSPDLMLYKQLLAIGKTLTQTGSETIAGRACTKYTYTEEVNGETRTNTLSVDNATKMTLKHVGNGVETELLFSNFAATGDLSSSAYAIG